MTGLLTSQYSIVKEITKKYVAVRILEQKETWQSFLLLSIITMLTGKEMEITMYKIVKNIYTMALSLISQILLNKSKKKLKKQVPDRIGEKPQ